MEGVTDFPTRLWFYLISRPDFLSTPFLRLGPSFPKHEIPSYWCPEILIPEVARVVPYQVVPQFMSPEAEYVVRAGEKILTVAPFIDLNCGCPAPNAVGKGAGSSILADPGRFADFLRTVTSGIGAQMLSVKMRIGYDHPSEFQSLLDVLKTLKVRRLTIHGRTREQGYTGTANWGAIGKAAAGLAYPVIGSGDVKCQSSLTERLIQAPQVDSIIIGRGALRNPFVFQEIRDSQKLLLELECLPHILAIFALLIDKFHDDEGGFGLLATELFSTDWPVALEDRCQKVIERLTGIAVSLKQAPMNQMVSRRALSRLKMLWGYMRTALPDIFFAPALFRAATLPEFMTGLIQLSLRHISETGMSFVSFDPMAKYDWMFAGSRRGQAEEPPL
jgi:tRNA-dihydrouridine synthase